MAAPLKNAVVTVFAAAFVLLSSARATTVIPPTFEEMVKRADLVFVGKVVHSRAEWRTTGADRAIFTLVEFETEEVLKGRAGKSVTLQFLGGTVGKATLDVAGVPKFDAPERVILFVEKNGVQFCPLVGVFHGKFQLRKDEKSGGDIILMHDGKPLRDVGEIGTGESAEFGPKRVKPSIPAGREPMSADTFKTRVREQSAKRPPQR